MRNTKALEALAHFGIPGADIRVETIPQGLINDSYRVFSEGVPQFILQRINTRVFPSPDLLMENISRLLPVLEGAGYAGLSLAPTSEGAPWLEQADGEVWRLFHYIPGSHTLEATQDPQIAREAGRVIGRFHQLVSRVPVSEMHTTLKGFHDLELRSQQLKTAVATGMPERIDRAGPLLELARELIGLCKEIPLASLPLRICHNDTKLSNILFEKDRGKGLCLVDLDTLMPGYLLYDFGDAARILLSPVGETHAPSAEGTISLPMFEAFAEGWHSSGLAMGTLETTWLCHGIPLMSTLHGVRTLTDFLTGDRYYHTTYPGQNLDRASGMLESASLAAQRLPELQKIFEKSG
jgi:aminoglycoside phosphotransferase (APT) family kinase protein